MKNLESIIKKYVKGLVRSETKTLIQFHNKNNEFICGYSDKGPKFTFYFQPLYDDPKLFSDFKTDIKPYLKGKSCLHFSKNDDMADLIIQKLFKAYTAKR